eukprot:COSAG06_NODE_5530_length_3421_cov_3.429561_6_plen_31_part_01
MRLVQLLLLLASAGAFGWSGGGTFNVLDFGA